MVICLKIPFHPNQPTFGHDEVLWNNRKISENCKQRGSSLLFATKKSSLLRFLLKTRANTQQVLPAQTGLYQYDE